MQPEQLRKLVRKWTLPVLALALIGALAAYVVSKSMTKQYQATGTVLVLAGLQQANSISSVGLTPDEVTATAAQLLQEPPLLQAVINDLHLQVTTDALAKVLTVTAEPSTQLVDVTVTDSSPQHAAQIANSLMSSFVSEIQASNQQRINQADASLEAQISQVEKTLSQEEAQHASATTISANQTLLSDLTSTLGSIEASQAQTQETVSIASPATPPLLPSSPRTSLNTALGGGSGLLIGLGLAALVEFLDQGLRNAEDVRERLGLPCLAVIPRFDPSGKTPREQRAIEVATEAYRKLRTNLVFAAPDEPLRSVVITSVRAAEGKSRTAANLAVAMASSDKRILLLDADMRRPSQHRLFRRSLENGFSDMILASATPSQPSVNGSHATDYWGLSLLPCGTIPPNPSELLASRRAVALMRAFEHDHDLVIVDTPPADAVTDPLVVAANTSAAILVVEAGRTNAVQASQVIDSLRNVGATVVGVVLNKATGRSMSRYYYYYAAESEGRESGVTSGGRRTAPSSVLDEGGRRPSRSK
jgi:succinoglycan biosynthesis transport protein ExoP